MTVPLLHNDNDTGGTATISSTDLCGTRRSSSTLDPTVDNLNNGNNEPKRQTRELPFWAKNKIKQWGERIRMPEWDADERICDEEGGEDYNIEGYRSSNGWKVCNCGTCLCILLFAMICLCPFLNISKYAIFVYHDRVMIYVIQNTLQSEFHIIVYNTRKAAWVPCLEGFVTLLSKQKATPDIVTGEV